MDLQFLKYQESWICNDLEILVTKKTYKEGHDMMILDYRPGKEPTSAQIREIYDKLSGIQTDTLFLTNYNDKTQKVALLEIDLPSFLNDNILQIKLDYNESKEKKKKSDLLPDQSRRNTSIKYCIHKRKGECKIDRSNPDHYCPAEDSEFNCSDFSDYIFEPSMVKYCKHCISFAVCNKKPFDKICDLFEYNPRYYEVSASDNTKRRQ